MKHDHYTVLGCVRWYAPWRKYVFHPEPCTLFEEDCLRDIAQFVQEATVSHREKRGATA